MSKNSEAIKLLRHMFSNGQINDSDTPKSVYESSDVFQKHKLSNFRTHFNSMRKEYKPNEGMFLFLCTFSSKLFDILTYR